MKECKGKSGMIDNNKVKSTHQRGIERVLQRSTDKQDVVGHKGKMGRTKK